MTESPEELERIQELLGEAADHFARGGNVWNTFGLDSPQFAVDAAHAALEEFRKSARLLDPSLFGSLPVDTQNRIAAERELALAHAASAESFLCDQWTEDGIEKVIEFLQQEIHHRESAVLYLEISEPHEPALLLEWQAGLLHAEARLDFFLARTAGRQGRLAEAGVLYGSAKEKFARLMKLHEEQIPELATIRKKVEETLNHKHQRLPLDAEEGESGVRWTARILRTSEQAPLLSDEDLYRRTAANYYASAGMEAHLDAFDILNHGGLPEDADKKLEESIGLLYSAMEVFPQNLEYHHDLFNAWRARGELFGCPMEETEEYFHTRCPLAIMHFIGAWYVSPTLEYEALVCTVCGQDILECLHYPGQAVDDRIVSYAPQNAHISSISLVDVPEDPGCRVEWISIPKGNLPSPPEGKSGLRCLLCQVENEKGELDVRLIKLPGWIEEKARERYRQIKASKRYRIIEVRESERSS